jgi:hypothetical protein
VNRFRLTVVTALVLATAVMAAAQPRDCSSLPTSAQRPRPCNPQEECLRLLGRNLQPKDSEDARRACSRHPTSGTCYGPDRYNPQAECRARERR